MKQIDPSGLPDVFTTPCDGCTACCTATTPELLPGEDYPHFTRNGRKFLMRNPDGTCLYQTPDGCMIQERKPFACRAFDCAQVVRAGFGEELPITVQAQGEALLRGGYEPPANPNLERALRGLQDV